MGMIVFDQYYVGELGAVSVFNTTAGVYIFQFAPPPRGGGKKHSQNWLWGKNMAKGRGGKNMAKGQGLRGKTKGKD